MIAALPTANQTTAVNFPQWQPATWDNYLLERDRSSSERVKLFFDGNYLLVDMGTEGINHASVNNLFTMLLAFWFIRFPEPTASSLGGCLIEKPNQQAAAPDLVLYIGADVPQWQEGETRKINLNQWRVPDLVGEIADTTLATDLDEKKQLYATLGIPEYWVIDSQGKRVFAFRLQADGKYLQSQNSVALPGLPITLLEQTLERLNQGTNISAAAWFAEAIASLEREIKSLDENR